MKRRILFVDDDPLVLQGLQRMLRPLRTDYDMEFKSSGAAALDAMERQPYDVVVADMLMPGMNGAELLDEVMRRHPNTVRLILSGHANRDMVARCVQSTHQYLSKPCDAATLKATIHRISKLDGPLRNDALRRVVGRMGRLPSLPTAYLEILDALQNPECELSGIGRIVARDIALTAQILKVVNSAFFGLRREIADPTEAVNYLGVDTLKSLALSAHLFTEYKWTHVPGFSLESLSQHSIQVAAAAKAIAHAEDCRRLILDESFCAGMLHDSGKLILAYNFPDAYGRVLQIAGANSRPVCLVERELLGVNHAEVAGYLLGLWGLPASVVDAIAQHHDPPPPLSEAFTPLLAVQAADTLVNTAAQTAVQPSITTWRRSASSQSQLDRWHSWERTAESVLNGERAL